MINTGYLYRIFTIFLLIFLIFFKDSHAKKYDKYALLICVDYSMADPYFPNLEYTDEDAFKVAKTLEKNFNFKTKILSTRNETKKESILTAFENLQNNRYGQLIIFFSGHGETAPNSSEIGYLIPSDAKRGRLLTTAINMFQLQSLSKSIEANQVLFIIDSCYSGISGTYMSMALAKPEDSSRLELRARQILTAGKSKQEAKMLADKKMSLYAYYLNKALSKEKNVFAADSNRNWEISLYELHNYILEKTKNHPQTPGFYNFTEDDGIFAFRSSKWKAPDPESWDSERDKSGGSKYSPDTIRGKLEEISKYHSRIEIGFLMNLTGGSTGVSDSKKQAYKLC
jgi:hypothetical protein